MRHWLLFVCSTLVVFTLAAGSAKIETCKLRNLSGNWSVMHNGNVQTPDGEKTQVCKVTRKAADADILSIAAIFSPATDFVKGEDYRVSLWAKSSEAVSSNFAVKQNVRPCLMVGNDSGGKFEIGKEWTRLVLFFKSNRDWPAKDVDVLLWFGGLSAGQSLTYGPLLIEELTGARSVDLKSVANFDFRDKIPGDGKGGWSDQGAGNDFAGFPVDQRWFCQIPFQPIDPAKNNGNAILSFECDNVKTGLRSAVIALPGESRRGEKLYLLHTMTWAPKKGETIGKIAMFDANGPTGVVPVVSGVDVADWWNPKALENAMVGFESTNEKSSVGVYVSAFDLPEGTTKMKLETGGGGNWIVIGATVAPFSAFASGDYPETIVAGKEWKAIEMDHPYIKPESALDFTDVLPRVVPCGVKGRVIINRDGDFAFENEPDKSLRFNGFVLTLLDLFHYPANFLKLTDPERKKAMDAYADAIVRQGYNLVRLHFVDLALIYGHAASIDPLPQKPEEIPFKEDAVDLFNYMMFSFKQRGIYVTLDLMTSPSGYTLRDPWNAKLDGGRQFRQMMYIDPQLMENWKAGATRLMTMKNPYTGTTLVDEPTLVFVHFNNEQHFAWDELHCKEFTPFWRKWVEAKYGTPAALAKAWPEQRLDPAGAFDHIPAMDKKLAAGNTQCGRDMIDFIASREAAMNRFYLKTVRDLGYRGPTNNFNNMPHYMRIPEFAKMEVVSCNPYIAHPEGGDKHKQQYVAQNSSLMPPAPNYYSVLRRLSGKPFVITEHDHVFWNRFRHEQGIFFGSLAALQGWAGICDHSVPVFPVFRENVTPFRCNDDPIARAAFAFDAFAYGRGDVTEAKDEIAILVTDEDIRGRGLTTPDACTNLSLIFRTGLIYADNPPKDLTVPPLLSISPVNGAVRAIKGVPVVGDRPENENSLVELLRRKHLFPAGNKSDPAAGIFQSETGELIFLGKEGAMTVSTPRLEGVCVKKNRPYRLRCLTLRSSSVPAAVYVASLSNQTALEKSERILLVIATDALNSGMSFANSKRTELRELGTRPVLLQTGTFEIGLKSDVLKNPVVWALKIDGTRADPLPVTVKDGELTVSIDTAGLPSGPTPFFEITNH